MHPPPPSPAWRRGLFALTALTCLAGCANGDFQEVRATFVRDDIHDWVGSAAVGPDERRSGFELTDDERQLRDLAYPLIQPAYSRHKWYQVAGEYGLIGSERQVGYDRTSYADHLFGARYRSPAARYARLIDDIRNDTTRLPQFFETATRVLDVDRKRERSMSFVSSLSQKERDEALRRVRANAAILDLVLVKLEQRADTYHFALERLVIMTPTQQAVEAEQALNQLRRQIAHYRRAPAPSFGQEPSLVSSR
jgi:hypothetical protein